MPNIIPAPANLWVIGKEDYTRKQPADNDLYWVTIERVVALAVRDDKSTDGPQFRPAIAFTDDPGYIDGGTWELFYADSLHDAVQFYFPPSRSSSRPGDPRPIVGAPTPKRCNATWSHEVLSPSKALFILAHPEGTECPRHTPKDI